MARSHAAARPTLRFPCQSQPRPEPRERPPAGDAGTSAAHKAPPPLRLHSERLHVNNMCLAPTSRPSHLHDRGRRSKTRRGRRLCFAVLTLSQAQSGSEALGKIWQLFVFVSVCVCSCVCSGALLLCLPLFHPALLSHAWRCLKAKLQRQAGESRKLFWSHWLHFY